MSADRKQRTPPSAPESQPPPAWPGDPESVASETVDFEAVAHLLANTCRRGGRMRHFHSLAQHALTVSEEIETLEGVPDADRRALALHALLAGARAAWLGDPDSHGPASNKAAERARRHGETVDRAVREAAGLDPDLPEAWAEVLRFVERMAAAAERRDLDPGATGGAGAMFPPLRRRIHPMRPERAAQLWLARLRELSGSAEGAADAGNPAGAGETRDRETGAAAPAAP